MNREIIFKAKRIDNGEWGEGQYAYITNPLTEDGKPIRHLICNGTNIFNDLIDPVTLCQFTGLRDNTKWGDLTEAEKESFLSDWNYREDRKIKLKIGVVGRFGRMIFLDIAMTMMEVRF